jgi:hypothetical protein
VLASSLLSPSLQWGHSIGSCGNLVVECGKARPFWLQWGHSIGSCGNFPYDARPVHPGFRFNGATALVAVETSRVSSVVVVGSCKPVCEHLSS